MIAFGNDWDGRIMEEFSKPYYLELREKLKEEYQKYTVYPDMYDIFNAFRSTPYSAVRAVILGQDPYHEPGQAHGLSFSVRDGVPKPPSLNNVFKELQNDLGITPPQSGCLSAWANSGVLLLNSVLTVRAGQAGSHRPLGWERFTDRAIELLNERETPVVFLLWGAFAKSKLPLITGKQHLVLTAAHPSPLSATNGFFGCRHFSKTNDFLRSHGYEPINWQL